MARWTAAAAACLVALGAGLGLAGRGGETAPVSEASQPVRRAVPLGERPAPIAPQRARLLRLDLDPPETVPQDVRTAQRLDAPSLAAALLRTVPETAWALGLAGLLAIVWRAARRRSAVGLRAA